MSRWVFRLICFLFRNYWKNETKRKKRKRTNNWSVLISWIRTHLLALKHRMPSVLYFRVIWQLFEVPVRSVVACEYVIVAIVVPHLVRPLLIVTINLFIYLHIFRMIWPFRNANQTKKARGHVASSITEHKHNQYCHYFILLSSFSRIRSVAINW